MTAAYCLVAKADTVPDTFALTHQLERLAAVSFLLTLLNIFCIFVSGIFIFRVRASRRITSGSLSSRGLAEIKEMYRADPLRGSGDVQSLSLFRQSLSEARPHHTISGDVAGARQPLSMGIFQAPSSFDGAFSSEKGYGTMEGAGLL